MSSESRRVTLGTEAIEYEVTESPNATEPRIDVDIHGVTVVLPEDDDTDPKQLLHENHRWVLDKRAKYESYRQEAPERHFEPGETFPYLGEPHKVSVERRSASEVMEGELRLAQHHVQQTSVRQALESLYRRKARERFEDCADNFAAQMHVEYEEIEIRNQRTKWGSCSSTGTLGLNWRLMMAPPEVIDYVVIHELAHLQEPNHTKGFWRLVGEYDPEYANHADWLDENSTQLIFSDEDL
jgi:predicted metal-dependent hydrolase